MEELLEKINNKVVDDLTKDILRKERNNLREERKRQWNLIKSRAPFYGRMKAASGSDSLKVALEVAEKIVEKLGTPWKISKRGRPPDYCAKKLASASLVKHYIPGSFKALKASLEDIGYDCRINLRKKKVPSVPCSSELHWGLHKIPEESLEEAVRLLDDWCVDTHQGLFDSEGLKKLGVDGTENACIELEEQLIGFKLKLKRQTDKVNALTRLITNSFCEVISGKSVNLKDLMGLLEKREKSKRSIKNLEIYGDAAYDAEDNYEIAFLNNTKLIVKPMKYTKEKPSGFYRKKGCLDYSPRKYKIRKTTERPFGNLFCRYGNKLHYRRKDMRHKGELLRFVAHNIRRGLR